MYHLLIISNKNKQLKGSINNVWSRKENLINPKCWQLYESYKITKKDKIIILKILMYKPVQIDNLCEQMVESHIFLMLLLCFYIQNE